jgi:hypothetical protein
MGLVTRVRSPEDFDDDGVKLMSVEDAKAALAGLEGKLQDALDRRDNVIVETARAADKAAAIGGIGDQSAKISLGPLNKRAAEIDSEIALLRMNISHAKRMLELAEAHAEGAKAKQAVERGAHGAGRLVQLEIRAPDGRVLRQFHRSVETARAALQSGYEITGQVISGNTVSPVGPGARSFMRALLDAHGDELEAWLAERGIVGSDKTVVVLPSNNRESMQ